MAKPTSRLERAAREIHETLADVSVECAIGRAEVGRHGKQRRIVWTHAQGRVERPRQAGGKLVGTEANGTRQTAIWMRLEAAEVHLYAEDEEALDVLFDRLLVAIDEAYPEPQIAGYTWTNDEPGQGSVAVARPKIVMGLFLRFPVVTVAKLQVVSGEGHECSVLTEAP